MNEIDEPVTQTTEITLPDGEVITIDGVLPDGWGYQPGRWYKVVELDDDDEEVWQRYWAIPASHILEPVAN